MPQNVAHQAADTIDDLCIALIRSDRDYNIDEALEVAEDLRALGDDIESGDGAEQFDTPNPGQTVSDTEAPSWSTGILYVTEVTDIPAYDYEIDEDGLKGLFNPDTVASENPSEPANAPVVLAKYKGKDGRWSDEYAFPSTRLDW